MPRPCRAPLNADVRVASISRLTVRPLRVHETPAVSLAIGIMWDEAAPTEAAGLKTQACRLSVLTCGSRPLQSCLRRLDFRIARGRELGMRLPDRLVLALLVVVVDTAAFAVPLAALVLAYVLLARPPWFRDLVEQLYGEAPR